MTPLELFLENLLLTIDLFGLCPTGPLLSCRIFDQLATSVTLRVKRYYKAQYPSISETARKKGKKLNWAQGKPARSATSHAFKQKC
jgi:hypothetical protein